MNIVPFARRNEKRIVYGLVLVTIVLLLLPLWYVTSVDEEEFRFAVISSVLHSRALFEGYYPFWTSYFGFGMPHPFLINFNYHPLVFIFANNADLAINLLYVFHLLLGSVGIYYLCRLYTGRYLTLLGILSYLMASPNINYLYTDFWPSLFVGWSLLPLIFYCGLRLAQSQTISDRKYFAIALGFLVAMLGLNAHPSQAVVYVISLLIVLTGCYGDVIKRFNYFILAGVISVLILAGKFYYLVSEASHFSLEMVLFKQQFGWDDLWSIFFRPIAFGWPSFVVNYNLEKGSRLLFVGGPLVVTALATVAWNLRNRNSGQFALPLIILLGIYVIRPEVLYSFASTLTVWREPVIILVILVALRGMNELSKGGKLGKSVTYCISAAQILVLVGGTFPFWYQLLMIGIDGGENHLVLKNLLKGTPEIRKVQNIVRHDDGRVYVSRRIADGYRSPALTNMGLTANSLPYFGIRSLAGVFKGISYEEICKGPYMYGRLTNLKDCEIENDAFLDIGAVKYVIKYDDEEVKQGLAREVTLGIGPQGVVGFYRNEMSWAEAVIMSRKVLNLKLPELEGCKGGGLGCKDLAVLRKYRKNDASVKFDRKKGMIRLSFDRQLPSNSIVMVSEYARPNWEATWYSGTTNGSLEINRIAGVFMGLDVPAKARYVVLEYVDKPRQYLELLTLAVIILSVIYLIVAGWIRSDVKRKEIEA